MAQYGSELGFKNYISFAESMVSGSVTNEVPFSQGFMQERAKANGIGFDKYRKRFQSLLKLRSGDEVHVYFGEDLFCQLNLITLLAHLERVGIPTVTYHVIFEDKMQETALIENVETAGYGELYKAVLTEHNILAAPLEITNKALLLYSDYLDDNGILASLIKANPEDSVLQLSVKIIVQLPEYGLGDVQCAEVIKRVRATVEKAEQ